MFLEHQSRLTRYQLCALVLLTLIANFQVLLDRGPKEHLGESVVIFGNVDSCMYNNEDLMTNQGKTSRRQTPDILAVL